MERWHVEGYGLCSENNILWSNLTLGEHFKLVRDHAPMLDRAAIVGDAGWQKMAVGLGKRLLGKEARYFPAEDHAAARDWLKS